MGAKISVDSATMMNKGLELIEAHHLFGMPDDKLDVLVHPQSIVHSLVAYVDGSVLAQLGTPDMRTPIACALAWPRRMAAPSARLDLAKIGSLTFEAPDSERFPSLKLAREALQTGGAAPTILNAANEVAVLGFLQTRIGFLEIPRVVGLTLERIPNHPLGTLGDVFETDRLARQAASEIAERHAVRA
jgi:1-deoxy-D-xylulose-5-phosphate reductoisomerase